MALEEARKRGLLTVALLGYDGGEIMRRGLADFPIVVHSRLYSANSGSAGVGLSRDARIAGGSAVARAELLRNRECPHTREMREWLESRRRVRGVRREADVRLGRDAALPTASVPCRCWSKTERRADRVAGSRVRGERRTRNARLLHSGARRGAGRGISSVRVRLGSREYAGGLGDQRRGGRGDLRRRRGFELEAFCRS